jgi:hypothetical protein
MEQRITRSTFTGGRAKSGDRGLASPAKQTPIPCSGSFTEGCTVFSEGWTGLGRALLAGLRWQGLGWPRARRAWGKHRWFRAPVRSSVRGGVRSKSLGLYRRGHEQRRRLGLGATRGTRGRARARFGARRTRRTRGGVHLPVFKSLLRSQTCESWQTSDVDLFLAPMAISCM